MKVKKKNNNASEFIRYIRGEMTKNEENAFQRELQKDPFAEEAEEGLSLISHEAAESDINVLQKRLDRRIKRRSTLVFSSIAASVAVLMVIGTVFIISNRNNHAVILSENKSKEQMPPEIIEKSQPIVAQEITIPDLKEEISPTKEQVESDFSADSDVEIEEEVEELKSKGLQAEESIQITVEDPVLSEPDLVPETAYIAEASYAESEGNKKMARAAAAPVNLKSEAIINHTPPRPIIGKDSFRIYLENNIRKPEPEMPVHQTTVINFKVLPDSTITNIIIISSPGETYSTESVRLIKDGPLWQPAEKNGKLIEDTISINIEFK